MRIIDDIHILSGVTSDVVDELVKSNAPTIDETHVHEKSISDVQDELVKYCTPALDETHVLRRVLVMFRMS